MEKIRKDTDPPPAVNEKGMRFHHIGIPTNEVKPDEKYLPEYKFYVSGFKKSEFGIEWMRFEEDSPVSEIIKNIPHIAFEVDDLESAIKGRKLLGEVTSPSKGIKVAMILENGAPIEFLEFNKK